MADREILLGCDCAGQCTILAGAQWEWEEQSSELILDFYETPGRRPFRARMRAAWRVLRGNSAHPAGGGLLFVGPDKISELRDFLTAALESKG